MLKRIYKQFLIRLRDEAALIKLLSTNPKFWLVLGIDVLLIAQSLHMAYFVRYESADIYERAMQLISLLPLIISVKVANLYLFGLYRGMWRYTSVSDVINILKATLLSAFMIVSILLYLNRFEGLSRSVFILDSVFTFLLIVGHRVAIRYYYKSSSATRTFVSNSLKRKKPKKLILIGAGDAAELVIRELRANSNLSHEPVGLVDDDSRKIGMTIHGVPVLGRIDDLAEHAARVWAEEILLTISPISAHDMKRIINLCQETALPYKILPGLGDLIDGKPFFDSIRDIDYRDLLGREEVHLDKEQIGQYLEGRTVLVTGAGGSIGSELCRQVIGFGVAEIILFDSSEENLYNIQMELLYGYQVANLVPILGKVQDVSLLDRVFSQHQPTVVFHAAAYKHVPLLENHPWQAVDNNIIGSQRLIEASIIHRVERFVLVSTDKAVRPTNVMGASKRITELLMHAYGSDKWDGKFSPVWERRAEHEAHQTLFMAVRFGNVLGSSGSVIPLFEKQIQHGGPVTVTDPKVTRYFMLVDEAAQLIIQAGAMARDGGEIFILKMGEPIKIAQMAADLIGLSGNIPGLDVEIVYIGLREGEKLYEELITGGEGIVETNHDKIMVLQGNGNMPRKYLQEHLDNLAAYAAQHEGDSIRKALMSVVPEYHRN